MAFSLECDVQSSKEVGELVILKPFVNELVFSIQNQ